MQIATHPTLLRRQIDARVRKLVAQRPVLGASLVEIARHCGRAGCRCQQGFKHVALYLTCKVEGKTRTVYVPKDLLGEVKGWIREHRRLKELMREISQLVLALVAGHVKARKRRGGC